MNKRGLITLLTSFGFLTLTVTSIALFIVPQGKIAYWIDWRLLGLSKQDWTNIHILSGLIFIIAGVFHLIYNWKPFVNYLYAKFSGLLGLKKEFAIATAVFALIISSAIFSLPPLQSIIDLNAAIKESWVANTEAIPPFGHAEQMHFKRFAKKQGIDLDKALAELEKNNIHVEDVKTSLEEIAKANRTTPMNIYMVIKKFETVQDFPKEHQKESPRYD
jgi:hypothetical protein